MYTVILGGTTLTYASFLEPDDALEKLCHLPDPVTGHHKLVNPYHITQACNM